MAGNVASTAGNIASRVADGVKKGLRGVLDVAKIFQRK